MAPNAQFPPRLNSPPLHAPNPLHYVPPPPSTSQNQTDSETESNESRLKAPPQDLILRVVTLLGLIADVHKKIIIILVPIFLV